jgi:hypothetical protein
MDAALNPFSPGSGRRPPELVGRIAELEAFDTIVARSRGGLTSRGIMLAGLRGVGKTVLLNEMYAHAERAEWFVVRLEARRDESGEASIRRRLARELVAAARSLNKPKASARMKRALQSVGAFNAKIGATGIDLGIQLASGRADSGDIEVDIGELVQDISTALQEEHGTFGIFVDEMQDLDTATLSALVAAQHEAGQRDWPFYVIGAGLPNLPRVLSDARSYAERLFDYRTIGRLHPEDAELALVEPATRYGAHFEPDALDVLVTAADGYPYFIQEYGQAIWNLAPAPTFTAADAKAAVIFGLEHLDQGFFRARWERATPSERRFLIAMSDDNDAPSMSGDVAARLGVKITSLGPNRANLMAKGLIYSPQHGQIAYTVPGMAAYVHRHREEVAASGADGE